VLKDSQLEGGEIGGLKINNELFEVCNQTTYFCSHFCALGGSSHYEVTGKKFMNILLEHLEMYYLFSSICHLSLKLNRILVLFTRIYSPRTNFPLYYSTDWPNTGNVRHGNLKHERGQTVTSRFNHKRLSGRTVSGLSENIWGCLINRRQIAKRMASFKNTIGLG
jgi:hypothetical protein